MWQIMETIEERVKAIEKEIRETPYHKGTQHHVGRLRARIAKLRDEIIERDTRGKRSSGGGGGLAQKKYGDATVVLVGFPSVGKSTLLNRLTNAQSKVAAYDFTTLDVIPGMMDYNGAKIQIFDIPGIIGGAAKGRGRGKEILSVARVADLLVLMVDVFNWGKLKPIQNELHEFGLRLNQKRPEVTINKRVKGGVRVISTSLKPEIVKGVAEEFRLGNAEIILKGDVTIDDLIDSFLGKCVYLPSLVVLNKTDLIDPENSNRIAEDLSEIADTVVPISAETGTDLDLLREGIWKKLGLIRIFLKPQGKEPDLESPIILRAGQAILDAARRIHAELADSIKGAQVWGKSAKFPGQKVALSHKLYDGDLLTFLMHGNLLI